MDGEKEGGKAQGGEAQGGKAQGGNAPKAQVGNAPKAKGGNAAKTPGARQGDQPKKGQALQTLEVKVNGMSMRLKLDEDAMVHMMTSLLLGGGKPAPKDNGAKTEPKASVNRAKPSESLKFVDTTICVVKVTGDCPTPLGGIKVALSTGSYVMFVPPELSPEQVALLVTEHSAQANIGKAKPRTPGEMNLACVAIHTMKLAKGFTEEDPANRKMIRGEEKIPMLQEFYKTAGISFLNRKPEEKPVSVLAGGCAAMSPPVLAGGCAAMPSFLAGDCAAMRPHVLAGGCAAMPIPKDEPRGKKRGIESDSD